MLGLRMDVGITRQVSFLVMVAALASGWMGLKLLSAPLFEFLVVIACPK